LGTREHIGFQIDCRLLQTLENGYVVTNRLFVGFWPVKKLADMTVGLFCARELTSVGYLFRFFHQSANVNTAQACLPLETSAALNLTDNL